MGGGFANIRSVVASCAKVESEEHMKEVLEEKVTREKVARNA